MLLSKYLWQILSPHWQMLLPLCVLDGITTHVRCNCSIRQMFLFLPLCDRCCVTVLPVYLADVIAMVADVIATQLQIVLADVIAMVEEVELPIVEFFWLMLLPRWLMLLPLIVFLIG